VVTVGVFDGVHLGHFHVLREVVRRAEADGREPTMVTFAGHPKTVLLGHAPSTVTSLEHRLLLFERAGIATTLVLDFTPELRDLTAEQFLRRVLLEGLDARELVFGFDSKFGRDRGGNPESLRPLSTELGFSIAEVPPLRLGGRAVSSTAVREAVKLGDFDAAATMLGRPISVLGTVVRGDGRGSGLGWPTANLDLHHELHPPAGVYAALVMRAGRVGELRVSDTLHPAVVHIGARPTFDQEELAIEVHVLDFEGDLYGDDLEVHFLARLRGPRDFDNADALVQQIERDVAQARGLIEIAAGQWRIPGAFLPIEGSRPEDLVT
jgi:riboflavin kinase/FMN adenylyltransferase